jgi:two-component system cell cycle sensor histidine kinase/response regulator CckA
MTTESQNAKILIVEDEAVTAKLLESRVRKFGHTPIGLALTGEAAIELAFREKPDLVLMDIRLQGEMDGIEAAKIIKKKIQTQIIYVTAHSEKEFLERAKPTIPQGYVLKPFQDKELKIMIEMALFVGKVDAERREAENDLKEREALLNATGMMAKVGGWELDAETLEVSWTEQTYHIHEVPFDYKPPLEEAINFFHPEDRKKLSEAINLALERGEPYDMEIRFITAKGNQLWTRTKCIPELVDSKVVKLKGTFQDITDRREAENRVRLSEKRNREIVQKLSTAIVVHDADNRIIASNKKAQELLGLTEDQLLGKDAIDPEWKFTHSNGKIMPFEDYPANQVLRTNQPLVDLTVGINRPNKNDLVWVLVNAEPVFDETGILNQILVSFIDITARKQAEDALKESEEKYRKLFDLESDALALIEISTGKIIDINSTFIELYGYTKEEILSMKNTDFSAEPDETKRATKNKETVVLERWHKKRDGTIFPVEIKASIFNYEGRDVHIAAIRDITERIRAEEALRQSENELREAQEMAHFGHWHWDINTGNVKWSDEVYKIFKLNPDEFTPHIDSILELSPFPGDRAQNEELIRRATENHERGTYEQRFLRPDGSIGYYTSTFQGTYDNEDQLVAIKGVVLDITDRKKTEDELRLSEARYRSLAANFPNGALFLYDRDYRYLVADGKAFAQVGLFPEDIVGKTVQEVFPELWDTIRPNAEATLRGEEAYYELEYQGRIYSNQALPVFEDGTTVRQGIVITQDITERINTEQEKEELQTQLQQAQKMEAVGTLAGGIAHDFNNLLQAINGYTQLLMMDKTEEEPEYQSLNEIYKSSNRASDLVRQLLLFSRKGDAIRKPVELNHEVEDARKMLERTIPKMVNIEVNPGGRLWPIMADPVQIEQILLNLGTNAADAMPEGGRLLIETQNVTLDEEYCRNHLGAQPGNYVLLTVTDTGHGISCETKEKIFDPFFTTKEFGKGTGLGLASVYGIVKAHEGYITCYSEVGMGTAFKIYLPAMETHEDDSPTDGPSIFPKGGTETILLVDDETSIRDFASRVLLKFGYTPLNAASGEEALEIYSNRRDEIDLVVIDLGMPGMGGHKCVKELMKINPDLKIIIASGYSINGQVKDTLEAGAKGFVGKPYQIHELLRQVRDVLDGDM